MRSRGAQILGWGNGSYCLYRISPRGSYSTHSSVNPEPPEKGGSEMVKERALAALKHAGILGREWGQWSSQMTRATLNYWWERYEEFVGLNEVREAQAKVTEAETAFMVSRGLVQEAQSGLEAVQLRLKEVRTRLDRVSREEAHYLELATLEHKLLQEERRLRTAHESSEGSEREKFALFSAAVRGSHEKERTRAERTKNWSIIGSVLGTIIGVMGSTYVNRVRLQELKSLLLEAQKGPESLQEALRVQAGDHRFQQEALQALIDTLRVTLMQEGRGTAALSHAPTPAAPPSPTDALGELTSISRDTQGLVDALQPRLGHLEEGLGRLEEGLGRLEGGVAQLEDGMCAFRGLVEEKSLRPPDGQPLMETLSPWRQEKTPRDLEEAQAWMEGGVARLEVQIQKSGVMNSVITIAAAALTVPALYILLRGT